MANKTNNLASVSLDCLRRALATTLAEMDVASVAGRMADYCDLLDHAEALEDEIGNY